MRIRSGEGVGVVRRLYQTVSLQGPGMTALDCIWFAQEHEWAWCGGMTEQWDRENRVWSSSRLYRMRTCVSGATEGLDERNGGQLGGGRIDKTKTENE